MTTRTKLRGLIVIVVAAAYIVLISVAPGLQAVWSILAIALVGFTLLGLDRLGITQKGTAEPSPGPDARSPQDSG